MESYTEDCKETPKKDREQIAGSDAPPTKPRAGTGDEHPTLIRRLYPPRSDAVPLYVQKQGAYVGKKGESLVVTFEGEEVTRVGLKDVSQLVLCGNVQVSTQTMHLLCDADIPVVLLSSGMWFHGIAHGQSLRNAYDRAAQFHTAADPIRSLAFARALVRDKGLNQRTQLRRNAPPSIALDRTLADMDDMIDRVAVAPAVDVLLGIEGNIARCYFQRFGTTLKPRDFDADWDFNSRNRRPPKDPVNAMLSFAYAMLAKECTVALLSEGLDPYWGLYHRPRHGRPSMALDLMEPFRPVIADSVVITAINTGMVRAGNFTKAASACAMNDAGRKFPEARFLLTGPCCTSKSVPPPAGICGPCRRMARRRACPSPRPKNPMRNSRPTFRAGRAGLRIHLKSRAAARFMCSRTPTGRTEFRSPAAAA